MWTLKKESKKNTLQKQALQVLLPIIYISTLKKFVAYRR